MKNQSPSEVYTLITCVEIFSHTQLTRVRVPADAEVKSVYILPTRNDVSNAVNDNIYEYVTNNFPELGVLRGVVTDSERLETCVHVSRGSHVFRLAARGDFKWPVCLVVPFEISSVEKNKIREKAAEQFPHIPVIEHEARKGMSSNWILGVFGGVLAAVVVYHGLKEVKGALGKHLGGIADSIASIATSAKMVATSADNWRAEGFPSLAKFNFRPALWNLNKSYLVYPAVVKECRIPGH